MARKLKFGSPAWRKKYMKNVAMGYRGSAGNRRQKTNASTHSKKQGPFFLRKGQKRNVAAGFVDEDGYFHPIRASFDYSSKRGDRSNKPKRANWRDPKTGRANSAYSRGLKAKKRRLREMIREAQKKNPPKLKRLKRSTGWMKASAVKIVKKGGQMQVLVRKPGRRKAR